MPPGPGATAIREPVRGLKEGGRTCTPRPLQLLDGRVEVLDFQPEMRTPGRTLRCGLHHLDERIAVHLKICQVGRAVRLLKGKRLTKTHLVAVEIVAPLLVGNADGDVIEPDDTAPAVPGRIQSPGRQGCR